MGMGQWGWLTIYLLFDRSGGKFASNRVVFRANRKGQWGFIVDTLFGREGGRITFSYFPREGERGRRRHTHLPTIVGVCWRGLGGRGQVYLMFRNVYVVVWEGVQVAFEMWTGKVQHKKV